MSDLVKDLSVVIPVYNEGDNIRAVFAAIEKHLGSTPEILICYDFEEDNTLPVIRELAASFLHLKLIKNKTRGVLGAIQAGFQAATRPAVLVSMADLSDDLTCVAPMLAAWQQGAVIVAASRYMPGGNQIGGPWLKKTLSYLAGVSLHFLTGIGTHDATSNFRLYAGSYLKSVEIESTGGFELALELTVKAFARGLKITEVPTTWRDRTAGESRFQLLKWLPKYLKWYSFALRTRFLPAQKTA